jgi:hypothetical protein
VLYSLRQGAHAEEHSYRQEGRDRAMVEEEVEMNVDPWDIVQVAWSWGSKMGLGGLIAWFI